MWYDTGGSGVESARSSELINWGMIYNEVHWKTASEQSAKAGFGESEVQQQPGLTHC